jgi:hypothetical protein
MSIASGIGGRQRARRRKWPGSGKTAARISRIATRSPRSWTTEAIADSFAGSLLAVMPVHERLGRDDYPRLRGALHVGLAAIADRFVASVDAPELARVLAATS